MITSFLQKSSLGIRRCVINLSPCHQRHFPLTASFPQSVRHQSNNTNETGTGSDPSINKKGVIVEKSPVKISCEEGKTYAWCACGLSKKQPLCDGSHKLPACGMKPVRFTAPKTKEYYFCNCKQTNKQPLCDGTHKKL